MESGPPLGRIGFDVHRLGISPLASRQERIERAYRMVSKALTLQTTIAFVGAGLSTALGYPLWRDFIGQIVSRTADQLSRLGDASWQSEADRLRASWERPSPTVESLLYHVGRAKTLLSEANCEHVYEGYIRDTFMARPPQADSVPNPYHALLKLPIRSFVTTNYDLEIEEALHREQGVPRTEFGIDAWGDLPEGTPPRSFTQESDFFAEQARIAMGRTGKGRRRVFHCHGRADRPDSMIASELDYQRWYVLEEQPTSFAFQQTIDLLFGSNPILFLGFGMKDADLLYPLRRFVAAAGERRSERLLFAMLPEDEPGEQWEYHDSLFERYGVHVLPFVASQDAPREEWAKVWVRAISGLDSARTEWRDGWIAKPAMRSVSVRVRPPQGYRHYALETHGLEELGSERVQHNLERLSHAIDGGAHVVAIVGEAGTGKSWHALRLLDRFRGSGRFPARFFWSSYYADDALSGVDRVISYLDGARAPTESRLEAFKRVLDDNDVLVVLDGLERLLVPSDDPMIGRGSGRAVVRLLETLRDRTGKGVVVITSRLWPEEFGDPDAEYAGVRRFHLERMRVDDIRNADPFAEFENEDLLALTSLLDGHAFGLALASRYLMGDTARSRFVDLLRQLSATPPHRRLPRMIYVVLERLDRETGECASPLLRRLALSMSPVTEEMLAIAYEHMCNHLRADRRGLLPQSELVRRLLESRLIQGVEVPTGETRVRLVTVHPAVREYVFVRLYGARTPSPPVLALAGFTSGGVGVSPGDVDSGETVSGLFEATVVESQRRFESGDEDTARRLARSAFGVLRSSMESNTVPRWTSYGKYARLLIQMVDLAKLLSPGLWSYVERHEPQEAEHPQGVLYPDELAWLYNDLGLALYSEGSMRDAYATFEQGYEINRIVDQDEEGGQYTVQSLLHLGHAFIELGRLRTAEEYLDQTDRANRHLSDRDFQARITGYRGLIAHLRGDLVGANAHYESTIRILEESGDRNNRAKSKFLQHHADLAIAQGDPARAMELGKQAVAVAEAGRHKDLVAYARLATGHAHRAAKRFQEARQEYQHALEFTRQSGAYRLRADALSELARLALDLGDTEVALRRAMEALRLATEFGLGLRQTHGLVAMGIANARAGSHLLGVTYLRHARERAIDQEYWLRMPEIEQNLHRLGEPVQ